MCRWPGQRGKRRAPGPQAFQAAGGCAHEPTPANPQPRRHSYPALPAPPSYPRVCVRSGWASRALTRPRRCTNKWTRRGWRRQGTAAAARSPPWSSPVSALGGRLCVRWDASWAGPSCHRRGMGACGRVRPLTCSPLLPAPRPAAYPELVQASYLIDPVDITQFSPESEQNPSGGWRPRLAVPGLDRGSVHRGRAATACSVANACTAVAVARKAAPSAPISCTPHTTHPSCPRSRARAGGQRPGGGHRGRGHREQLQPCGRQL